MPTTASSSSSDDLDGLLRCVRACRSCIDAPLKTRLPHEPRPVLQPSATARLLIAGQAPGVRVHRSGIPFSDPSGDRLRSWLGIGPDILYDSSRVAMLGMSFCFPGHDAGGGDLPPRPECRRLWHDRLLAAMPRIETVVMIGAHAQRYHLGRLGRSDQLGKTLTETVARWRDIGRAAAPRLFPLPHPSWRNSGWIKRHPWFEAELLPVLREEVARLVR